MFFRHDHGSLSTDTELDRIRFLCYDTIVSFFDHIGHSWFLIITRLFFFVNFARDSCSGDASSPRAERAPLIGEHNTYFFGEAKAKTASVPASIEASATSPCPEGNFQNQNDEESARRVPQSIDATHFSAVREK